MVLKKSKIVRRQKSRNCWFLDTAAVGTRRSADAKVCGRFSEMPRGPSHRCARNASAALENFVPDPQKTFSTVSTRLRHPPPYYYEGYRDHFINPIGLYLPRNYASGHIMPEPDSIIAELEDAVRSGSSEKRVSTLRQVTDLSL